MQIWKLFGSVQSLKAILSSLMHNTVLPYVQFVKIQYFCLFTYLCVYILYQ